MVPVLPGGSTTGGGREGEASGVDRPGTATPVSPTLTVTGTMVA